LERKLRCKRCKDREWIYRGNSKYYTTCPICKTSINIRKNIVVENDKINSDEVGGVA